MKEKTVRPEAVVVTTDDGKSSVWFDNKYNREFYYDYQGRFKVVQDKKSQEEHDKFWSSLEPRRVRKSK